LYPQEIVSDYTKIWFRRLPDVASFGNAYGGLLRRFNRVRVNIGGSWADNAMISIVDDDRSIRVAAKMLIQSLGYTTATFASAEAFLQSGRVRDTTCLITDVQMPGMSGVDLQSHLTACGHCTPVIFITGYAEERIKERALEGGAFGFLSKPFSEESLIACLDRAMEYHRATRAE